MTSIFDKDNDRQPSPWPCAPVLPSALQADPPGRIGVYDSGVGGVSVLRAIRAALPRESLIYVADSGLAPYGDRTPEALQARAEQVADFFVRQQVKALVLACNTISVIAAANLRAKFSLPIVAMEPAIKPAALVTITRTILVMATANTVRSQSVARLCAEFGGNVRILLQACPGLVECVERGEFTSAATLELVASYVRPGIEAGADTIVLGCTHYAFLAAQIADIAGPGVTIIESSVAVARQLSRVNQALPLPEQAWHPTAFYTSGPPHSLSAFLTSVSEEHTEIQSLPLSHTE